LLLLLLVLPLLQISLLLLLPVFLLLLISDYVVNEVSAASVISAASPEYEYVARDDTVYDFFQDDIALGNVYSFRSRGLIVPLFLLLITDGDRNTGKRAFRR
jgi:hypothetical protein